MSDNPHVMSKYATELDCLRARDKWHQERIATLEADNAELRRDAERLDWLIAHPIEALDIFGDIRPNETSFIRGTIDAATKENGNG